MGNEVYMVAGGVPTRTPNHAKNVAGLALQLADAARKLEPPAGAQAKMALKIGISKIKII